MHYPWDVRTHIEVHPKARVTWILDLAQDAELEVIYAKGVMLEIKNPKLVVTASGFVEIPYVANGQKAMDLNGFQPFREFSSRSCLGLLFFEPFYPGLQFGDLCIGGSALSVGRNNNRTQKKRST